MLRKIAQSKLGVSEPNPRWFGNPANATNENWLKSRFHFSFAEYSNPANMGFGILRVMNDDLVQPNRGAVVCSVVWKSWDFTLFAGFGEHGHSNAEICTYIVDGYLTHQDSMGTSETLSRGDVQFMVILYCTFVAVIDFLNIRRQARECRIASTT